MFRVPKPSIKLHHLRNFSTTTLHTIRSLCFHGRLLEAFSLFFSLNPPSFHSPSLSSLFHACARFRNLPLGRALHRHVIAFRSSDNDNNIILNNHILNMYAKCGELGCARKVFDEMPQRNVVSWTALVSGYAQMGLGNECFGLFCEMVGEILPSEFAVSSLLSCCCYDQGRQVHGLVVKIGLDGCVFVVNSLIGMYSKKGNFCGEQNEASNVFLSMKRRNLVTWNSMITGFQINGLWVQAIEFFSSMRRTGIGFDRVTLLSVVSSLCEIDRNSDLGLRCCLQIHGLCIKSGSIFEVEVSTVLVKAYSNLGGSVFDCYQLFIESSGRRDNVSWTAIITSFAEEHPEEALSLFNQLRKERRGLDHCTVSSILKASSGLVNDRHCSALHSLVVKTGLEDDIVISNALIHSYARCGSIVFSKKVFDETKFRDTVTWNSVLKAYAMHGCAREALDLFYVMDLKPDSASFVAVLTACSHGGLVEEGLRIFNSMSDYGVAHELDHYACMVDMLGRAGRVLEAENVVRNMPIESDPIVWSALLGACRKYNETGLGKASAMKLREMDPGNSLGYVLMSNLYNLDGRFDQACLSRKSMDKSRVKKRPGLSWIGMET